MSEPRYATVSDLVRRGITADADTIKSAILRAEEWIDNVCRQRFAPTDLSFDQDGSGHNYLFVEEYPIIDIQGITFQYGWWGPVHTALLTDVIIKSEEGVIVYRREIWPAGDNNIHIEGRFGWEKTPELIKEATILFAMAGGGNGIPLDGSDVEAIDQQLQSESIGSYSYSRKAGKGVLGSTSTGIDAVDRILHQFIRPLLRAVGKHGEPSMYDESVLRRVVGDS